MKRKLSMVMVAAAVVLFVSSGVAFAQVVAPTPVAGAVCCSDGKPNIPAGQQCLVLHQVGPGENLHVLAAYYYGDARAWRLIYNVNQRTIRNPNTIYAGQVLRVEVPPCWSPRFDLQEFLALEQRRVEALNVKEEDKGQTIVVREVVKPTVTVVVEEEVDEKDETAKPKEAPKTETLDEEKPETEAAPQPPEGEGGEEL